MKYSKTALMELSHQYKNILKKCALINAIILLSATASLPVEAETINTRVQITESTTYTDLIAEDIHSTTANNGGVFYLENVPSVALIFDGETSFINNSISGGMGGAIGNGWLATKDSEVWSPYTPGGKIVFNGPTVFEGNSTDNQNGGGAIFNYGVGTADSPDIVFNDSVIFDGNTVTTASDSVYIGGGALNHMGGSVVFNEEATFTENESVSKGGAIMSAGDIIFKEQATFTNNSATIHGGALAIIGGSVSFEKEASFSGNSAGSGSAISMEESNSILTFQDMVSFKNNNGTATLWNNNATGEVYFENGALFENNTNTLNGTLQNTGSVSVSGGDLQFLNNTGSNGGGLKNAGTVSVNTTGNVLFDTNTTTSSAGAFDNGGTTTISASTITFNQNASDSGYGGAIFNAADLSLLGQENTFTGNVANDPKTVKSGGGAIHNRGNTGATTLVIGSANSTNTFGDNISKAHGGAIVARAVDGAGQDSLVTINGTTLFTQNSATANGGAIWNYVTENAGTTGTSGIVFNGETTFSSNTAGGLGGAIYNNDNITFNGVTIFENNMAGGSANDIYNDGVVNFNGDVTLEGGINGSGEVIFASGTSLSAELKETTILADTVTFEGNNTLKLTVANGLANNKYDLITATTLTGEENVTIAENPIYRLSLADGQVEVSVKSGSEIVDSIDVPITAQEADTLSALIASNGNGTDAGNQIATAMSEAVQNDNAVAAVEATKELAPTTSQAVMGATQSVNNVLSKVADSRMATLGRSGGDAFIGGSIWAQGLYNHAKQSKDSKTDGFKSNSRGFAVGLDGKVNQAVTIGIGYGYTNTNARAGSHRFDINGNNFFAYAKYQPTSWFINGILNYGYARYSEKKAPMGIALKAKYDVDSYAANLMTGYDFKSGLTPEAGLRYLLVDQETYHDGAQTIRSDKSNLLTGMMGARYSVDLKGKDWMLKPTLHVMATYDMVSDNNKANVSFIGGGNYQITGERLHRFGVEAGAGITASVKCLDLSLEYNGGFRKDFQNHTGMLKAKYNF